MSRFIHALKAGVKAIAKGEQPASYSAAGAKITCSHCKNGTFYTHEALLNTSGAVMMRLEWLDDSGMALICANCGLIQWFIEAPEQLTE